MLISKPLFIEDLVFKYRCINKWGIDLEVYIHYLKYLRSYAFRTNVRVSKPKS